VRALIERGRGAGGRLKAEARREVVEFVDRVHAEGASYGNKALGMLDQLIVPAREHA
jgi:hypothetical protein